MQVQRSLAICLLHSVNRKGNIRSIESRNTAITVARTKFAARRKPCIMLGYSKSPPSYYVLWLKERIIDYTRSLNYDEIGFVFKLFSNFLTQNYDTLGEIKNGGDLKDVTEPEHPDLKQEPEEFMFNLMRQLSSRTHFHIQNSEDELDWYSAFQTEMGALENNWIYGSNQDSCWQTST